MATSVSTDIAPEPSVDSSEDAAFAALEARVLAVAEALRQTRTERDQAQAQRDQAQTQREQAQAELAKLHHAHAQAERELVSLRKERNEVRQRVGKLVAQLEASLQ